MSLALSAETLTVAAGPYTSKCSVHASDLLFQFILKQYAENGVVAYFSGGKSDAMTVHNALVRWHGPGPARVLEFASGYGRIARYADTIFEGHEYVASDIHEDAC